MATRVLDDAVRQTRETCEKVIMRAMEVTMDTARVSNEDVDPDDKHARAQILEMENAALSYAKIHRDLKCRQDIVSEILNKLQSGHQLPQLTAYYGTRLSAKQLQWNENDILQNPEIQKFRNDMGHSGEDVMAETGLMISQVEESFICPLTTAELDNPYKSRVCGHNFSYEAIRKTLMKKPKLKCPQLGCQHYITLKDLQENKELKRRMKREKRKRNMQEEEEESQVRRL